VVEEALREGTFTVEKFVEAFPVLVDAAGGTRQLREMVRNLAVRGRLQTQRESDGIAFSLVEATQVQEGSVGSRPRSVNDDGSTKEVPPPASLPSSWTWAAFTNVATIASNLVNPAKYQRMPHVAPDNIEKGTGRLLPYSTIAEDGVTSGKHRFCAGQVLYSKIRPNLNKVVVVDFDGLCSADMYPLTPRFDARYLQLFLLSDLFLAQVVRSDNRLAAYSAASDRPFRRDPIVVPAIRSGIGAKRRGRGEVRWPGWFRVGVSGLSGGGWTFRGG